MVKVRSCQGFAICQVSPSEARALEASDPSIIKMDDGSLQFQSYQNARDNSPTSLTLSDIRLNAGECGAPKPLYLRRDGEIDPVEAAKDKVKFWPRVGDVKREVLIGDFCPILFMRHKTAHGEVILSHVP